MALSIQSNMASKSIQNQLSRTNNDLSVALERLGSGFRINSAKDDAAGLQIANRLNAQVRGQEAAIYNANNAQSMLQTAEGAFEEMTNIAYRMKELATQAANGTNNASEYTALDAEYQELALELDSIMTNTSYGSGTTLLDGGKFAAAVTFQVGATAAETLAVDISAEITALAATVGAPGALANQAGGTAAMATVNTLIDNIGAARSALGASMNRLDHTINNVTNMAENTQAAAGQLMDADFAKETSSMTKQQLLMNSGISVLSASNSTTQMIGSLLR
ncbi:flagellin FliC [Rheinheimera muenzenbergensis]|uniref:Flagellin n=1 Tax=Rheinheimera muenzenbergensis TaxID=1193628 RepID=A0ABU8C455_9GAMM|nr:Lateral flagellin [Gammaproteobacteria bacterium]MBU1553351.1 Lateral flagellin [Gammaproteobacteria bacterium]MBU2070795.1 Lateral flagellin [Gammaproteobacteria bacterium]MBU2182786.1 Lateral flagellin [Gammaproteobacteria bacterium]MBU2205972.1 Lateral flagellin [Gammaproteobacteria bacterium]